MLAELIINVDENNSKVDLHGTTEVLVSRPSDDGTHILRNVITHADTKHDWWKTFSHMGENILVDNVMEIQRGVWISPGGNFHSTILQSNLKLLSDLSNITNKGEVLEDADALYRYDDMVRSYLVCDNEQQAIEYWKGAVENEDNQFIISLMPIYKSEQPESGGWRWCKWGEYIGTQNSQCEYMFDEPEIEMVYCAHIYNVKEI